MRRTDCLRKRPVFYVGDSDIDAETAEAAGIPFLIYTKGYRRKEINELTHAAAFSDFAELPALVGQMADLAVAANAIAGYAPWRLLVDRNVMLIAAIVAVL